MSRILVHFSQVGGANALRPVLDRLAGRHNVSVSASGLIQDRCGLAADVDWRLPPDEASWLPALAQGLDALRPDLVLTDTIGARRWPDSRLGSDLWALARERGVPSLAYVDCWWAYTERFPGEPGRPGRLPDRIATIDDPARDAMLAEGFPPGRVVALGSPRLAGLRQEAVRAGQRAGEGTGEFLLVHMSSPVAAALGPLEEWGLSELTVARDLLAALDRLPVEKQERIRLLMVPHPEEDPAALAAVLAQGAGRLRAEVALGRSLIELLRTADLVTGIFSIALVEAVALNRPVVSLQPGLRGKDMLITNAIGATRPVREPAEFDSHFLRAVTDAAYRASLVQAQQRYTVIDDSLERWEAAVAGLLAAPAKGAA